MSGLNFSFLQPTVQELKKGCWSTNNNFILSILWFWKRIQSIKCDKKSLFYSSLICKWFFLVFCANLFPFDRRNTLQFLYLMVFLSENFFKLNNRSCNYHKLQNIQSIFEKIINIFSVPSNITTCWERIWSTTLRIVSGTLFSLFLLNV